LSKTFSCPRCTAAIAVPATAVEHVFLTTSGWCNTVQLPGGRGPVQLHDGTTIIAERPPREARVAWHCGQGHALETAMARAHSQSSAFAVDGGSAEGRVRLRDASHGTPAGSSHEPRERHIPCARSGCGAALTIANAHSTGDALVHAIRAYGWHAPAGPGGRIYCGQRCSQLDFGVGAEPPVKPVTELPDASYQATRARLQAAAAPKTKGAR
jgi:hypothetical protein